MPPLFPSRSGEVWYVVDVFRVLWVPSVRFDGVGEVDRCRLPKRPCRLGGSSTTGGGGGAASTWSVLRVKNGILNAKDSQQRVRCCLSRGWM